MINPIKNFKKCKPSSGPCSRPPRPCCRPRPHSWWRRPIYHNPCVLIYQNKPVPLKKVTYDVAINGGLANVTLSQEYFNTNNTPINVTYNFPVNDEVVFGGIEAIFRNRKVAGKIKEKTQAKMEFLAHKAAGDTVVYAEQVQQTEDIMKVELGNFPPNEPLTIAFKYMVKLDVINDVNWAFRIPSTLTPRYNPDGNTVWDPFQGIPMRRRPLYCPKIIKPIYYASERYTWEINVSVYWPGGVKNVQCLSHPNAMTVTKNPGIIKMTFNPNSGPQYPNQDFEIMIQDNKLFSNTCQVAMSDLPTISGGSPKYAAMMQFIPSMYEWYAKKGVNETEGVDIYSDDHNDFLMERTLAEYVFIIDRSGSMRGTRIEKARRALVFFLKSLPYNSQFNVISFGGSYQKMFPQSVPYNTQNLNTAIQQINKFSANLGGTVILNPLNVAFSDPKPANYQRNVFLLTDGAVSNNQQVFNSIESNCAYNTARVFSIGIGNGCSELLVKRSAKLGNGMSVIISDDDNVEGKIINLLNASFSPSLTNFKVDFDPKYICAVSPMPNQTSHITRGEPFTMYALIKNDIETSPTMSTEIKVSFYDSVTQKNEVRVFGLNLNGCIVDSSFHKMCIKKVLDGQKRMIKSHYLDPVLEKVPNIATKLAVAYQVLSADHTAFICVVEKNTNGMYAPTEEVIVPSLESVDYSGQGNARFARAGNVARGGMRMMKMSSRAGRGGHGGNMNRMLCKKKSKKSAPQMMSRGMAMPLGAGGPAPPAFGGMRFETKSMKNKPAASQMKKRKKKKRNSSMMECEQEIGMESISSPQASKVNEIVLLQQIRGFWNFDQNLINSLGITEDKIPAFKNEVTDKNVLMTILLLAYLLKNGDQSTLEIIINKGMGYLRKQNLPNYKAFVESATSIF